MNKPVTIRVSVADHAGEFSEELSLVPAELNAQLLARISSNARAMLEAVLKQHAQARRIWVDKVEV